ncbi:MAG: ABC transporter ATP-binding protein [Clostridiales bacterium]|jgi:ABC-2 type transport system ATP-binding protein|nr:ABC transporter ATP-binding protein [Clostridiales bacterium]
MFQVNHVTKRYGKLAANQDITFSVGDGDIAVLIGPNGAGKSTIIKCIAGLLRFEGDIDICGYPNKTPQAKSLLGYIPEMPAVYDLLTVEEHMEFIGRAYSLSDWQSEAERLLDRFELTDKKGKLGKELSKGMQQKLSICCAILHRPRVVIFDEPMVGLDPHAIKELKNLFQEMKADGASLLISTHMLDSVEDYWDTAHIMMNGEIAATKHNHGDSAAVGESEESLEELFFRITEAPQASQKGGDVR